MEIDNRSGANALGGNGTAAPSRELDRDAFMRLLVTQIRNQDPLDPMDTRDMMNQLAQLTSVEHLIGIEEGIATLQVASASIANAQVADFVGKNVVVDTSSLRLEEVGPVHGGFELDASAERVTVEVRDSNGRVVRSLDLGAQVAGVQSFEWDGRDDSGTRLPPGRYRVEVSASNGDGQPVAVHTRRGGRVTGVSYRHGYPELILDGEHHVLLGDVREVAEAPSSEPVTNDANEASADALTAYAASVAYDPR